MAENGGAKGDEGLLLALASGQTVRDAAQAVGIGERTATRRLADPEFRQRLAQLRAAMVSRAVGKLADGMVEAADVLRQLLQAESESVRLSAARTLLDVGNRLRESMELEERIRALERKAKALQGR
jgi:HEAT repeat protein